MLTFFIIVASFHEGDRSPTQFQHWQTFTLEQCEDNLQDMLFRSKMDFDVAYNEKYNKRTFVVTDLPMYPNSTKTRLNCVEVKIKQ